MLSKLLDTNQAEAVIACTVRNCNTMESFFNCIREYKNIETEHHLKSFLSGRNSILFYKLDTLNLQEKCIETESMWKSNQERPSEIKIFSIHRALWIFNRSKLHNNNIFTLYVNWIAYEFILVYCSLKILLQLSTEKNNAVISSQNEIADLSVCSTHWKVPHKYEKLFYQRIFNSSNIFCTFLTS